VPPERIYTGLPPIRQADGSPLVFPYISLTLQEQASLERTSSGTLLSSERVRFAVYSRSYDEARQIAATITASFNRRALTWSGGHVLDMRPAGRDEAEDASDCVWRITVDFQVQVAEIGRGLSPFA
jgi:hypothetical protein